MIGIVTVLYNSGPVLDDFFQSLSKQTNKDFVLYAIDNKSNDNSLSEAHRLSSLYTFKTIILPQCENVGVAKGNNIGIKKALEEGCDYVLLANNDIIMEDDCIDNLLEGMKSMNAPMAVPKIYYYDTDKLIWAAGGCYKMYRCGTPHRGNRETDHGQYDKNVYVDYAPTCFMLIHKDVFERVGLMDERYFVYYDDADFVWRAVKSGCEKLAYVFTSVVWHKVSFSTGGSMSNFYIRYFNRNKVYFARKHFNIIQKFFFYSYLLLQYVLRSRAIYTKEQRKLYKDSCIEGWKYYQTFSS